MMSRTLMFALVAAMAAGCDESNSPTSPSQLSETVTIPIDQRVTVRAAGLTISFDRVVSDSRCPIDVQCVQAGDAELAFTFERGSNRAQQQLRVNDPTQRRATFDGYVIEVRELQPARVSTQPLDPSSYRATLHVSAAP